MREIFLFVWNFSVLVYALTVAFNAYYSTKVYRRMAKLIPDVFKECSMLLVILSGIAPLYNILFLLGEMELIGYTDEEFIEAFKGDE